jgi:CubicO group peptidase (beta-lactamase class C family)
MTTNVAQGLCPARLERIGPAVEQHVGPDGLAGVQTLLWRRGAIAHQHVAGFLERETDNPLAADSIFRIFSMTKPITCVAMMMLIEQGRAQLFDPVARYIPAFADTKVLMEHNGRDTLVKPMRPVNIRDLLTHTSGMSYHFLPYGEVEARYRNAAVSTNAPLAEFVDHLASMPLAFQPGTAWRYSFSHDVVARLVEVIAGQPFGEFLQDNILGPLGMVDTGFHVPADKLNRFGAQYGSHTLLEPDMTMEKWFGDAMKGRNERIDGPTDALEARNHGVYRGGHGLVSTAADYLRFCRMMLGNGELEGTRLLGRKTLEAMTTNHLPIALLPYEIGGIAAPGYGYGLGFRVLMDLGSCMSLGSVGEYGWSGAASTYFWIDPAEDMIGIQLAAFQPSGYHMVQHSFRMTAYQAIVD